jgi:hypothetical protein
MVYQDKLERLAELTVPDKVHPLLHVNCRDAWIKSVLQMVRKKEVRPNMHSLLLLAKYWEFVLYKIYSTQN